MKGLIVKEKWLKKIFDEKDPKDWEIRGSRTKIRGRILLIQSGSGNIVGECELEDCIKLERQELKYSEIHHKIKNLDEVNYNTQFAWVISKAKRYDEPIPYEHPKGAVIWVNLPERKDLS